MWILLRFAVIFMAISTVFSMVRNVLAPPKPRRPVQPSQPQGVSTHLVKDPVCGTYIPETTAIHWHEAFFCSEECRRKYASG
jgi:hypothetical protein